MTYAHDAHCNVIHEPGPQECPPHCDDEQHGTGQCSSCGSTWGKLLLRALEAPPLQDIDGYQERPAGVDPRAMVSQRMAMGFGGSNGVTWRLGGWDWMCLLCHAGTGAYPLGREGAVSQAHAHLAEEHPEEQSP
jgi:hypothetical protein